MDPLRGIDLNLLLSLHHLLESASVGQAAKQLSVGQPAMSANLNRLRNVFDDPLLIRDGRSMRRTERADELRSSVQMLVEQTRSLLTPLAPFDPARDAWTARIAVSDETRLWLVPRIVARLERSPHIDLRVRRLTLESTREGRTGEIDLAVFPEPPRAGPGPDVSPFIVRPLYTSTLLLVLAPDHPRAAAPWSIEEYAAASHVLVAPWDGEARGTVDEMLEARGLQRRILVTVPTYPEALEMVRSSQLVSLLPEVLARHVGLATLPSPVGEIPLRIYCAWHPRAARDPRVQWLRALVEDCVAEVVSRSGLQGR